jgi:hypothetical protein
VTLRLLRNLSRSCRGAPAGHDAKPARSARLLAALLVTAVVAGCGGSSDPGEPLPSPSPSGDVSKERLQMMLLQSSDLAGLSGRRVFAAPGLTSQMTPQLSLCRPPREVVPHEIANVIASVPKPGGVKVFEVLSVHPDEKAAIEAYDIGVAAARACTSYTVDGIGHRVTALAPVEFGAGTQAVHYALVTSDIVSGDVRTYARRGRYTVLISGFGATPTGQPLLAYQETLMRKALARLE